MLHSWLFRSPENNEFEYKIQLKFGDKYSDGNSVIIAEKKHELVHNSSSEIGSVRI